MTTATPLYDDLVVHNTKYTDGLWAHQADYVLRHSMDKEHVLLWQPRVGKSLAALRSVLRWRIEAGVKRVLLAAPKTVCQMVWAPLIADEAQRWAAIFPDTAPPQMLDLYSGAVVDRANRLRDAMKDPDAWVIAVVNRDALSPLADLFVKWGPGGVVLDELHDYKTPSVSRARAIFRIARGAQFRRGLTGTPASEGYESLYGQWKIVSPKTFGTNKSDFLERYVQFDPLARYPKILGYKRVEELREKAFAIASIVRRSDCFEIPPEQDVERHFDLPPAARKVYDTIVNDHVLELAGGIEVPVRHTFARLAQLRQIATGYTRYLGPADDPDADLEKKVDWLHDELLSVVRTEVADIVESGEKIVVWHAFSPEREHLLVTLKEYSPLAMHGGTSDAERARAMRLFAENPNYPVLVVQEQLGALGLSMAAANYACFASFGLSRATHIQARDRIFKPADAVPGKTLTTIYPLARGTVVESMRRLHASKASAEEFLLSGDRTQTFVAMARGIAS